MPAPSVEPTARSLAWEILNQIDLRQAWAEEALAKSLRATPLAEPDERLCRELLFGTVKERAFLDFALAPYLKKKPPREVLNLLRLGVYQLLKLTRVPAYAAVNESVKLCREGGFEPQAAFVNAVLRQVERGGAPQLPDPAVDPIGHASLRYSLPCFLVERWVARFGALEAERLMVAANAAPPVVLRANGLQGGRDAVLERLRAYGLLVAPGLAPESLLVEAGQGNPSAWPGRDEGWYYFQDQGSQLVGHVVDPQPGQTCLDVCSAPGGKATHLAERMQDRGAVLAWDRHTGKLKRVAENAQRLKLKSVRLVDEWPVQPLAADRVLVDAPCSGLGTLRRHAEVRWRVSEPDLARLAQAQLALLTQAAEQVRPGGDLIYSTCSTEPEENEAVVQSFLQTHPEFRLHPGPGSSGHPLPEFWDADGSFRTFPRHPEMDGLFAVRLRRTE